MIGKCEVCGSPVRFKPSGRANGRGRFCSKKCFHERRWETYRNNLAKTFWDRVDRSAGPEACWSWLGRHLKAGYGRLVLLGKHEGAHRIAYSLIHGPIQDELFICHRCDNPPCCNPAHLFEGTHADNMADRRQKGRYGRAALRARQSTEKE